MGDSIQTPHEYRVWMSSQMTLEQDVAEFNFHLYVPKIITGEAVWILDNKNGKSTTLMT